MVAPLVPLEESSPRGLDMLAVEKAFDLLLAAAAKPQDGSPADQLIEKSVKQIREYLARLAMRRSSDEDRFIWENLHVSVQDMEHALLRKELEEISTKLALSHEESVALRTIMADFPNAGRHLCNILAKAVAICEGLS